MKYTSVLIDADIVLNKACFVAEERYYKVRGGKGSQDMCFPYMKDVKQYVNNCIRGGRSQNLTEDSFEIVKVATLPNEQHLYMIIDNILEGIKRHVPSDEYKCILGPASGTKIYRHKIAKFAPYKGNRDKSNRPISLLKARNYLLGKYDVEVAHKMEADDLLGIIQCRSEDTIVASIDKDLLQIPGYHYNLDTKEISHAEDPGLLNITKNQNGSLAMKGLGFKWFAAQMLLGDPADNIIKPKKGLGNRAVYNLLNGVDKTDKMWYIISKIYEECKRDIYENATLLWIKREDNDTNWEKWL